MPFAVKIILLCMLLNTTVSWSKEAIVIDSRRPISLENNEVQPKDFFINAGTRDGLKKGMVVPVYRRTNLYDRYQNKSLSDLMVQVGQLKIIHVQDDLSVARMEELKNRELLPTLEYDTIMIGDRIQY